MIRNEYLVAMAKALPSEVVLRGNPVYAASADVYMETVRVVFERLDWLDLLYKSQDGLFMMEHMQPLIELGLAESRDGRVWITLTGKKLARLLLCLFLTDKDLERVRNHGKG